MNSFWPKCDLYLEEVNSTVLCVATNDFCHNKLAVPHNVMGRIAEVIQIQDAFAVDYMFHNFR